MHVLDHLHHLAAVLPPPLALAVDSVAVPRDLERLDERGVVVVSEIQVCVELDVYMRERSCERVVDSMHYCVAVPHLGLERRVAIMLEAVGKRADNV